MADSDLRTTLSATIACMNKGRMEAFSDGVLAIIITIMVLELRPPHESNWESLGGLWPKFTSYVLSFLYLAIYWNNHHHMLQRVQHVRGGVLWANMHLLFWLSLIPFSTAWMGETHFARLPVIAYGTVLLMAAIAYFVLSRTLIRAHGHTSEFAAALGSDFKGKVSILLYALAIALAWASPYLSCAIYVTVALIWLVPDRRFE